MESHRCWCGGALDEAIGPHYRRCLRCGAAVLATCPALAGDVTLVDETFTTSLIAEGVWSWQIGAAQVSLAYMVFGSYD